MNRRSADTKNTWKKSISRNLIGTQHIFNEKILGNNGEYSDENDTECNDISTIIKLIKMKLSKEKRFHWLSACECFYFLFFFESWGSIHLDDLSTVWIENTVAHFSMSQKINWMKWTHPHIQYNHGIRDTYLIIPYSLASKQKFTDVSIEANVIKILCEKFFTRMNSRNRSAKR